MNEVNYPKIKNAIVLCLLVIGIQLIASFIFGIVLGLFGYTTELLFGGIGTIIIQIASFASALYVGWKKTKESFNSIFKFNAIPLSLFIYTVIFSIGLVIVSSEIDNIFSRILPMPAIVSAAFSELLVNQSFFVALITIAIIPAFTEEMLFRGLFITGFSKNYSTKKSILVGALLFGLIHLNPWQFVTAFIVGIFTGWIFYTTKSIVLCIYIHFFNNFVSLIAVRFSHLIPIAGFNIHYAKPNQFQPWWFNTIGIVLVSVGFVLLRTSLQKKNGSPAPFKRNIYRLGIVFALCGFLFRQK